MTTGQRQKRGLLRPLQLRTQVLLYLALLHLVLGVAAVFILMERRTLLFAVEGLFLLSVVVSVRLVRSLFVPLDLIRTGAELLEERDFTSRFVEVGQPELDALISVYNRMADRLRDERLAAEEQHHLLQKIVDASPAGIVICDFDGHFERFNPAATALLTPELRETMVGMQPGQSRMVAQLGARRVHVTRAEFRDRGFLKSFYVIEEMTEELRLSEKSAYEKLIRMMSHEVNNSVGAVRSLLESSLRYAPQIGVDDRGDFESALTIASRRVDSLNRFMSDFADVVRIPTPRRRPVEVAVLVEHVAVLLGPELDSRRIRLDCQLEDRGAYEVDPAQIEQVILNVVRNAIEAIGSDGLIRVSFRDGQLVVRDSGSGISDAAQGGIFTPFFTTKRDGRGLGLTIVHEILANHALPFSLDNASDQKASDQKASDHKASDHKAADHGPDDVPRGGAEFRIDFSAAV